MRVDPDRLVDPVAVQLGPAGDQGEILLFDRAGLELRGQAGVGQVVPGHEDHAAGVAVEAVDDARPAWGRRPAELAAEMVLHGAGQRAGPVPAGGMDHHSRRLVDHREPLVLVEDFQGMFWAGGLARRISEHHDHALAGEAAGRRASRRCRRPATPPAVITRRK